MERARPGHQASKGNGERRSRIRMYARNIRRKFPQLGEQLRAQALAKVEKTQRAIRLMYAIRTLAVVAAELALAFISCRGHR